MQILTSKGATTKTRWSWICRLGYPDTKVKLRESGKAGRYCVFDRTVKAFESIGSKPKDDRPRMATGMKTWSHVSAKRQIVSI